MDSVNFYRTTLELSTTSSQHMMYVQIPMLSFTNSYCFVLSHNIDWATYAYHNNYCYFLVGS